MKKSIKTVFLLLLVMLLFVAGCQQGEPAEDPLVDDPVFATKADLPRPTWGDNIGGRAVLTQAEVDEGTLGGDVIINSLIDNIYIQDSRLFMFAQRIAEDGTPGELAQSFAVMPGETYQIFLFAQNDNPGTVSTGTRAAISLPVRSEEGVAQIVGSVYSDNAVAPEIWSTLPLASDADFQIRYEYGSAELRSAAHPEGWPLEDTLVTKAASERGVLIGYERLDGELPGGEAYRALVTITIRIAEVPEDTANAAGGADTSAASSATVSDSASSAAAS